MKGTQPNHVGTRLRSFRDRHGWSLRALAERCGLSINAISRIERGENSPTIVSLDKLAKALGVPITDFFVEKSPENAVFLKSQKGQIVNNECFIAEKRNSGSMYPQLDPFVLTISPHCQHEPELLDHPGQEFVFCLSGTIEYNVDGNSYLLNEGDSLLFEGRLKHCWLNPTDEVAVVLIVFQAAQDNQQARTYHLTG